jgi:hypothetical protein
VGFEPAPCCVAPSRMSLEPRDESERRTSDATRSNPPVRPVIIAGMCGRFTLRTPARDMVEIFELLREPDLTPRFNERTTR